MPETLTPYLGKPNERERFHLGVIRQLQRGGLPLFLTLPK